MRSTRAWSRIPTIREDIDDLIDMSDSCMDCVNVLKSHSKQNELRAQLNPFLAQTGSAGYAIFNANGLEIASSKDDVIGNRVTVEGMSLLYRASEEGTIFVPPFFSQDLIKPVEGKFLFDAPIVWVATALYDEHGFYKGVFGVARYASRDFSDILNVARLGKTGETYAFDKNGKFLTNSRFESQLRRIGLLSNEHGSHSMLRLSSRDPGGRLMDGHKMDGPYEAQPLTKPVAQALASRTDTSIIDQTGVIIEPFRDYRGEKVIGAWKWMPAYDFGVVSKQEAQEAFGPLLYLDLTFALLISLLAIFVGYSLYSSLRLLRLDRKVGEAVQLGQYTLVRKIGEGGIGQVYLANHSMLKRPTAVKILKTNAINADNLRRFEREVQLASRLTHPNTIEIYDYGKTPDGVFYYAMELLNGFTLSQVVQMQGAIPFERALFVLEQVVASVAEAHSIGLIHRDIKPQNIMLVQRGGMDDVVKVLDFGLVKDIFEESSEHTRVQQITGTPLYMAPERLRPPHVSDMRSDIYAIGAVGYYLIAGMPLFDNKSDLDVMYKVLNQDPLPLHQINREVPSEVEELIFQCIAKNADDRPENAIQLLASLRKLRMKYDWQPDDARKWWKRFE